MPGKNHPIPPYNLNALTTRLPETTVVSTDNYQPQPSAPAYTPPRPVLSDPFAPRTTKKASAPVAVAARPQYGMTSALTRPSSYSIATVTPATRRAPAVPYRSTVSYSYPATAPAPVTMGPERPCFSVSNATATHAAVSDACMITYLKGIAAPCSGSGEGGGLFLVSYLGCCLIPATACKTACCVAAMPLSCTLGCFKNRCNRTQWDEIQKLKSDPMRGYDPTQGGGGAIDCKPCERNCIDPCTPCFACCTTIDPTDASYYRCLPDACRYS